MYFELFNGRNRFYQWDINQKLIVKDYDPECEIQFKSPGEKCAILVEPYTLNGETVVDVPNKILQHSGSVVIYVYFNNGEEYTKKIFAFDIIKRQKPADYIYTESEVLTYKAYDARLKALEENGGVSSWNDLTDKPFEDVNYIFANEQTIVFDEEGVAVVTVTAAPNIGDNVTVKWNGVDYTCLVEAHNGGFPICGNAPLLNGTGNNGKPFIIIWAGESIAQALKTSGTAESASVKITGTIATKIEDDYFNAFTPLYLDVTDNSFTYIYSDVTLTHKITTNELFTVAKIKPIVLIPAVSGAALNHMLYVQRISIENGVGVITTIQTKHYAAEYTP